MMHVSKAEFIGGKEADDAYNKLCELTGLEWDVASTCRNLHKATNAFECSECGEKYVFKVPSSLDWWSRYNVSFCPNCGARVIY